MFLIGQFYIVSVVVNGLLVYSCFGSICSVLPADFEVNNNV